MNAMHNFISRGTPDCRLLVVGDLILDRYYYASVKRISPEAPVPVALVTREKETLGGAANVAHNLARLGCAVRICGYVGYDYHGEHLSRELAKDGVPATDLVSVPEPTTTKVRVIGGHQQMLRLDFEQPLSTENEPQLLALVRRCLPTCHAVILSDYGKGVCTETVCRAVITLCRERGIPVLVDPKGADWSRYKGADWITPNLSELNEVQRVPAVNEDAEVVRAARYAMKRYNLRGIVATRSERGLSLVAGRQVAHIPTLAQEVYDVSGAGDTVIAVMALAIAGKLPPKDAAYLANLAAGVVVAKVGTYAISRDELLAALESGGRA